MTKINLDDYVDVVGGRLDNLDLTDDLLFQFYQRKTNQAILIVKRQGHFYYGKIYIPKKYFGKEGKRYIPNDEEQNLINRAKLRRKRGEEL